MKVQDLHDLAKRVLKKEEDKRKREPINCHCGAEAGMIELTQFTPVHHCVECTRDNGQCWQGPWMESRDAAIDEWDEIMGGFTVPRDLVGEWRKEKHELQKLLEELQEEKDKRGKA